LKGRHSLTIYGTYLHNPQHIHGTDYLTATKTTILAQVVMGMLFRKRIGVYFARVLLGIKMSNSASRVTEAYAAGRGKFAVAARGFECNFKAIPTMYRCSSKAQRIK
jgi:hypothetical protein